MKENTEAGRPSEDDVEAHGARFNGVTDESRDLAQDDVAGHGARFNGVTDEPTAVEDDDTEGHSPRVTFP
jgi:hypothetical protein